MHRLDDADRGRINVDDPIKLKLMVGNHLQILLVIGDIMTMLTDATAQAQGDAPIVKLQRVGEEVRYGNVTDWLYISNIPNDAMNGRTFTDALPKWAAKMPEVGQWLYVPTTTTKAKRTRNRRDADGLTKEEREKAREEEKRIKREIAEKRRQLSATLSVIAIKPTSDEILRRERDKERYDQHYANGAIRRARTAARRERDKARHTAWRESEKRRKATSADYSFPAYNYFSAAYFRRKGQALYPMI